MPSKSKQKSNKPKTVAQYLREQGQMRTAGEYEAMWRQEREGYLSRLHEWNEKQARFNSEIEKIRQNNIKWYEEQERINSENEKIREHNRRVFNNWMYAKHPELNPHKFVNKPLTVGNKTLTPRPTLKIGNMEGPVASLHDSLKMYDEYWERKKKEREEERQRIVQHNIEVMLNRMYEDRPELDIRGFVRNTPAAAKQPAQQEKPEGPAVSINEAYDQWLKSRNKVMQDRKDKLALTQDGYEGYQASKRIRGDHVTVEGFKKLYDTLHNQQDINQYGRNFWIMNQKNRENAIGGFRKKSLETAAQAKQEAKDYYTEENPYNTVYEKWGDVFDILDRHETEKLQNRQRTAIGAEQGKANQDLNVQIYTKSNRKKEALERAKEYFQHEFSTEHDDWTSEEDREAYRQIFFRQITGQDYADAVKMMREDERQELNKAIDNVMLTAAGTYKDVRQMEYDYDTGMKVSKAYDTLAKQAEGVEQSMSRVDTLMNREVPGGFDGKYDPELADVTRSVQIRKTNGEGTGDLVQYHYDPHGSKADKAYFWLNFNPVPETAEENHYNENSVRKEFFATPEMVDKFNQYYKFDKENGTKMAEQFLDAIDPYLNYVYKQYKEYQLREAAEDPYIGPLARVSTYGTQLAGGITGTAGTIAALFGSKSAADADSWWYKLSKYSQLIRETQNLNADKWAQENLGTSAGTANFLLNVVDSVADNLVAMYAAGKIAGDVASKGGMRVVQTIMSAEATSNTMLQKLEAGYEPKEAAVYAVADGVVEWFTERVSLEALLKPDVLAMLSTGTRAQKAAKLAKFIGKATLAEGSEEINADLLNWCIDDFLSMVNKHATELEKEYAALVDGGMDPKEAQHEVLVKKWEQIGLSGLAGSISGFALAGGRVVKSNFNMKQTGAQISNREDLVKLALESKTGELSQQQAEELQKRLDEGKKITDKQAGKLAETLRAEAAETLNEENSSVESKLKSLETMQSVAELTGKAKPVIRGESKTYLATPEEIKDAEGERTKSSREVVYYEPGAEKGKIARIDGVTVTQDKKSRAWDVKLKVTVNGETRTIAPADMKATNHQTAQVIYQAATNPEFYSEGYTNLLLDAAEKGQISEKDLLQNIKDAKKVRLMTIAGFMVDQMPQTSLPQQLMQDIWAQSLKEHGENRTKQVTQANRQTKGNATFNGIEYGTDAWKKKINSMNLDSETLNWMDTIAGIAQRAGIRANFTDLSDNKTTYGWESKKGIGLNINGRNFERVNGQVVEKQTNNKHHLLVTFGHEMTHWLQRNSLQGYNRLEQYVLKNYINDYGYDELEKRIERHMYGEDRLSLEDAISEIVADSCDQILMDKDVQEHIAKTDSKLYAQIKGFVKDLIARFKKAVIGMPESASTESVAMARHMNEIGKLWTGAYDEALSGYITDNEGKQYTAEEFRKANQAENGTEVTRQSKADIYRTDGIDITDAIDNKTKYESYFTYENLIKKAPLVITDIGEEVNNHTRKETVDKAVEKVKEIGGERNGNAYIHVDDTNSDVYVSNSSIRHSLDRRTSQTLMENIGELLKNSICINIADGREKNQKASYYLLSAARNNKGMVYVSINVNRYTGNIDDIDVMYSTRENEAAGTMPRAYANNGNSLTASTVSISEALNTVKKAFANILPIDVMNYFNEQRRVTKDTKYLRYSKAELDDQYMQAVKSNDEQLQQEIVAQAAARSGFDTNEYGYHGTPGFGFTVWNMDDSQNEIYVSYSDKMAATYTHMGELRKIGKKYQNMGLDIMNVNDLANELEQFYRNYNPVVQYTDIEGSKGYTADEYANVVSDYVEGIKKLAKGKSFHEELSRDLDKLYALAHTGNKLEARTQLKSITDKTGRFDYANEDEIKDRLRNMGAFMIDALASGEDVVELDKGGWKYYITRSSFIRQIDNLQNDKEGIYRLYTRPGEQWVIDAKGANWNRIKIDDADMSHYFYGDEDYNTFTTREIADYVKAKHPYLTSIRINNVYDHGGRQYSESRQAGYGDIAIFFNQNDVKSADPITYDDNGNVIKPSERFNDQKKDIRWSKADIEETRDLIAYHNLTADQLMKVLRLGGFAVPSIGITRDNYVNDRYGEISIVFNKNTIDPKLSRLNKVYGGDAWTITYPNVEYKVSDKKLRALMNRIDQLVPADRQIDRVYLYMENLAKDINNARGDAVQAVKRYDLLKQAYIADKGINIETPMREKRLGTGTKLDNAEIIRVAEALGEDVVKEAYENGYEWYEQHPEIRQTITDLLDEMKMQDLMDRVKDEEKAKKMFDMLKEKDGDIGYGRFDSIMGAAYKYFRSGVEQEVDEYALRDRMNEQIDEADYEKWLQEQLDGIIEKKGIRNNKDYYTNTGNARSWEQLHDEETLENVVRVMTEADEKAANTFFNQSAILALGTKNFKSIEDIRKNKGQLQHISDEEMSAAKTDIVNRFGALADELTKDVKGGLFEQLEARDRVRDGIVGALRKTRTASGIKQSMKQWNYNLTDAQAQEIVDLMEEISNLPTEYFEAKPARAVGLDEIVRVLVPEGTSDELIDALADQGIEVEYYDGTTEDRLAKMQAMDDVKFSKYTPDSMDVQSWMQSATPSTFQTEDERALWETYRGMRVSMSLSLKKQLDYQTKIRELESRTDLTPEERNDLMALRNRLEIEKQKLERMEDEMFRITTGEGFAAMMYRNNIVLKDFIQGKTQDQVRQTVEDMLKLVEKTQEEIRKDTAELKKLAQSQAVQTMKSYMGKSSLSRMASNLRKAYNSTMNKAEIEDRLAEMVLKQASGMDITADTEALAQDLVDRIRGMRSDTLENLRGRTLVIGQETLKQLKAENSSLKEIRSRLKGSGVTIKTEQNSRLDEQWAELRENDQSLPNIDDVAADIDKLHTIVDFISGEMEASRGANQYNLDMDEITAMVRASVGNVTTYLSGDAAARKQISSLMKQIADLSGKTEKTAADMEALEKQLDDVLLAGQKAKGWTSILQRDVSDAIRYYNRTAKVAAQVEKNEVRKKLIETLRSQHTKELIQQQERFNERLKKERKTRELVQDNQVLRRKISTVAGRMANRIFAETDQKNVPEETKPLVRQVLKMIASHDDLFRRVTYDNKKQITDIMQRLEKMDQAFGEFNADEDLDWLVIRAANEEDNDYEVRDKAYQLLQDIEMGLLEYRNAEGQGMVSLMDRKAALTKVQEALSGIWSMVQARSEAEIQGRKWQVYELAEMLEEGMQNSRFKGERTGFGRKARTAVTGAINYGNMTPEYFIKNLKNAAMNLLHSGLHDAENRSGLEALRAKMRMQQIAEETGYATWDGQEKHKIRVKGGTIEATTEQIMALYATWKREQNQLRPEETAHLLHGGFVLAPNDMDEGRPGRRKMEQRPVRMSKDDLNALGSYLTEQQRAYVDAVVGYMSSDLAELGNEASMKMYGIKKFTEQFYFPIKSWGGVLNSRSDAGVNSNNENRAAHWSASKRIKANASNAIQISDFTPTAMKHITGMITYNTIAPAVENINKVLNQQIKYGEVTEEEDNTYKRNMRAAFQEAYGKQAYDYLLQFMKDVNGGLARRSEVLLRDKLLSIFKKNAVAGSLSVAAQQPLSYIRAAMLVNPKYLAQALSPQYWKGSYAEMIAHSGLAVIKEMGKFDMNYGQTMTDYITPEGKMSTGRKAWNRFEDAITSGPQKTDAMTWTRMWTAVKLELMAENKGMDFKSDEFMDMVMERFNELMRRTQVYDSVMVKSQNMRSDNYLKKVATSFMAEPTLSLNVLEDAWMNRKEKGGKARVVKALATFALSAAAQAGAKAFFGTGRSPKDKKNREENFLSKFWYNFFSEINVLGLIPGYKQLIDVMTDGELDDDAMGMIGKAVEVYDNIFKLATGDSGVTYRMLEDSVGQLLQLATNIPAKNLMRDFRAMVNFFSNGAAMQFTGNTYANRPTNRNVVKYDFIDTLMTNDLIGMINKRLGDAGYGTSAKDYYQRIYDAEKAGNKEYAEEMKDYLINGKMTGENPEKTLQSALSSIAKKDTASSAEDTAQYLIDSGASDASVSSYVKDRLKKGDMKPEEARDLLKKIWPDKTEDEIWWTVDRAEYAAQTGQENVSGQYYRLYDAISSNKSDAIKDAVQTMTKHGMKAENIKKQIGTKYKKAYMDAKGDEKIRMKDALTKAYKAIGLTAEEALKIMDGWKPKEKK